jgi:hypothetical protein
MFRLRLLKGLFNRELQNARIRFPLPAPCESKHAGGLVEDGYVNGGSVVLPVAESGH